MLPFTQDQFLALFGIYNHFSWPVSVGLYFLTGVLLIAMVRHRPYAARTAYSLLALMWAWSGVTYHLLLFSSINPAAYLFAAVYALAALMFAHAAVFKRNDELSLGKGWSKALAWLLIFYAIVGYPLAGLALGHAYAELPQFGTAPCPITILTLGILLLFRKPRWHLLVVPIAWALVGGSASILLSIIQDWPLLIGGPLAGLAVLLSRASERSKPVSTAS